LREALFIKKNADKWETYQHQPAKDPDEVAERFITLIDDLSYAKTFYPRSKVTRWVNGIAASIYQSIYSNRKEKYSRFFAFWKYELPLLFGKYRRIFLFTGFVFALFTAIGFFSSQQDPDFVRGILGDNYVRMTEQNIAKGDPFGVYKDNNPFSMFARIAYNNIFVSFLIFIKGLTLGIFTFFDLWNNGIMLGSFQQMFFASGLGLKSVLVVWIHGTIEISSIIIAGASGFILANGIMFPGTYTRRQSFRRGAKDALKILICLIPFFIIAAFLESYITHLMSEQFDKEPDGMPAWVSVCILAGSLIFMVWYFIVYPVQLGRKGIYKGKNNDIVGRLNQSNDKG
jgi:uncharacterized membrane protein SpoIIM required for sporulation